MWYDITILTGRVFPRRGRVPHLTKKIDCRNPGEGFILKYFNWENPGGKIKGRVFPIITPAIDFRLIKYAISN